MKTIIFTCIAILFFVYTSAQSESESLSKDAVDELIETLKLDLTEKINELIDSKIEELKPEISDMMNQSITESNNGTQQLIEEVKVSLNDGIQVQINAAVDKSAKYTDKAIENISSSVMLSTEEKIKNEKEELIQRINDQNAIISELKNKIKEFEKNVKPTSNQ